MLNFDWCMDGYTWWWLTIDAIDECWQHTLTDPYLTAGMDSHGPAHLATVPTMSDDEVGDTSRRMSECVNSISPSLYASAWRLDAPIDTWSRNDSLTLVYVDSALFSTANGEMDTPPFVVGTPELTWGWMPMDGKWSMQLCEDDTCWSKRTSKEWLIRRKWPSTMQR